MNIFLETAALGFGPEFAGVLDFFMGFLIILLIIALIIYIYFALAYMSLAKKTNTEPAWLAWIPYANLYLISKTAGMHWWPILLLIPAFIPSFGNEILNNINSIITILGTIIFLIYSIIWDWKIFEKVGKPGWWALSILLFPLLGLGLILFMIFLGIAAWSKSPINTQTTTPQPTPQTQQTDEQNQ